jgi:undecaprenyl diphosphate synthase
LNELFADWFTQLATNETIHREHIRIRAFGEWRELLAAPAVRAIENLLTAAETDQGSALTFLIGYDGDRELVAAIKALIADREERQETREITLADLRAHAWTHELPPVDLLVRTGAWTDPHRSANFLPFLTSNVQEAYPPVFWPAFSEPALDTVLADFAQRERRIGR